MEQSAGVKIQIWAIPDHSQALDGGSGGLIKRFDDGILRDAIINWERQKEIPLWPWTGRLVFLDSILIIRQAFVDLSPLIGV